MYLSRLIAAILFICCLPSCSSGGGGSDGGKQGGAQPTLATSQRLFHFVVEQGEFYPRAKQFSAWVDNAGSLSGQIYVKIDLPQNAPFTLDWQLNGNRGEFSIRPADPDSIGLGKHTSWFNLRVCLDSNCRKEVGGSPIAYQVKYDVIRPSLNITPSVVEFEGNQGQFPAIAGVRIAPSNYPSHISVADFPLGILYAIEYEQPDFQHWLEINSAANNLLEIGVNKDLSPGEYSAKLHIEYTNGLFHSVSLPISFSVFENEIHINQSLVEFTVNDQTSLTELAKSINVTTSGDLSEWYIASKPDWLNVEINNTSNSNGDLNISLNNAVSKLKNGIRDERVRIQKHGDGETYYELSVYLDLQGTQFDYVNPYFGFANTPQDIRIYGENFSNLNGSDILLNDIAVNTYEVISDSELKLSGISLEAGEYEIKSHAESGALLSKARYHVLAQQISQDGFIAIEENQRYLMTYEPVSNQIFFSGYTGQILRVFRYLAGNWVEQNIEFPVPVTINQLQPSIDGESIYVLVREYEAIDDDTGNLINGRKHLSLYQVDMQNLEALKVLDQTNIESTNAEHNFLPLSDEELLFVNGGTDEGDTLVYNLRSNDSREIELTGNLDRLFWATLRNIQFSQDRSYIEILVAYSDSNRRAAGFLDLNTDTLEIIHQPFSTHVNHDGSRRRTNENQIVDQTNQVLGTLSENGSTAQFGALSGNLYIQNNNGGLYQYTLDNAIDGVFPETEILFKGSVRFGRGRWLLTPDETVVFYPTYDGIAVEVLD